MNQTRKIVVEHYPVDRLPEELRLGLEDARDVTITIEAPSAEAVEKRPPLASLLGKGRGVYQTPEQADAAVRALRDEWP